MHGRRSLSVDLKEFDPEIEHTLKALGAQGKFSNTCQIKMAENPRALREYFTPNTYNSPIYEAWDLFENLSDNSQQHATSSRVGTSRQIGNRGMFEVSQNVDLSVKVDALSKKFDQLLALNTLPTNSPNVQSLESMTQILDSHTQSIAKLETQIGQLANAISRRDEGKLPSHPIENPRANYHEQAKAVITIRNGKLVDNKVGDPIKDSESNNNETKGISITKIERKIEKELASSSNFKTLESSPTASYKPKGNKTTYHYYGDYRDCLLLL
ncbi:hypothetical protein M9H77_09005 [Catharanthus roseus]|uniref:Uncharacterized protein n=1 Tax=Catharanthus roseus TaxID=4058 RepID=A0ACC0BZH5_CATRO|nr:hypothetical protein M9H77_09005 [Catharanthus roseus]